MNKPYILIVEDDPAVQKRLAAALENRHYQFRAASNGEQALRETMAHTPDVILLEWDLPDMDGICFIKKIRSRSAVPIIIISARGEDRDKIEALDAGADDYMTKPFSVAELLARLRVTFRRSHAMAASEGAGASTFANGELRIDFVSGCVYKNEEELHLTPIEYKLLCLLSKHVGQILTHSFITKEIWGSAFENDLASLRVFMTTLRKKIEPDPSHPRYIQTHVGMGYRMVLL
ncbi:MAG TPA: DNA-binding response regulator [Clostridiales bacterium]|nr:DNA-binding response regulator [Clostridiales bacterium]